MVNQFPSFRGDRLESLRKLQGKTQKEMAASLGCTAKQYRAWAKYGAVPGTCFLLKMCRLFDVDCDYLLGRIDEKTHDAEFVCRYTGLSQDTIDMLHLLQENNDKAPANGILSALNKLLGDDLFYIDVLQQIPFFFEHVERVDITADPSDEYDRLLSDEDYEMLKTIHNKGFVVQSVRDMAKDSAERIGESLSWYLNSLMEKPSRRNKKLNIERREHWRRYIKDDLFLAHWIDDETEEIEKEEQHGNDDETDE